MNELIENVNFCQNLSFFCLKKSINQSKLIKQSINQFMNDWLIDWLKSSINQSKNEWMNDWLIDWLIEVNHDWLIDFLCVKIDRFGGFYII